MSHRTAQMVITDPPYNISIDGNVCGSGRIKHQDFVMAAGEMSAAEFTDFLERAFSNLAVHSIKGSVHFVFIDWLLCVGARVVRVGL